MAIRSLTVNYRCASLVDGGSFEQVLRECIDAELTPGKRFSQEPADRIMVHRQGDHELVLNEFADVVDGVAGIICEIIPGSLQPTLKRDPTIKQLTQATIANIFQIAEQAAGDKTDFIQGLCYFYVRHNHLIFVSVKGFRKSDVQPFFSWMFARLGKSDVSLSAGLDRVALGNDIGRVSNFRIRGNSGGRGVTLGVDREIRKRLGSRTVGWSKAEEVVQTILPQASFEKLMGSLGDKNRLVADVQWSVAGPRSPKVKDAIQDIVTELANMDDGVIGINGRDGKIKEDGVILEMSRPFDLKTDGTILIDFDHATDVLVSTFKRWVEDHKISVQ